MTRLAFRIIGSSRLADLFVRIMAGDATNTGVRCIEAAAAYQAIRLETNIFNALWPGLIHTGEGSMTPATKVSKVETAQRMKAHSRLRLAGGERGGVFVRVFMTGFALDARDEILARCGHMAAEAARGFLFGEKPAGCFCHRRVRELPLTIGYVETIQSAVEADTGFIQGVVFEIYVGLAYVADSERPLYDRQEALFSALHTVDHPVTLTLDLVVGVPVLEVETGVGSEDCGGWSRAERMCHRCLQLRLGLAGMTSFTGLLSRNVRVKHHQNGEKYQMTYKTAKKALQ